MKENTITNKKNVVIVCTFAFFLFGIFVCSLLAPDKKMSESERRYLAEFPELNAKSILSGKFMEKFESYALDQFPKRDSFRMVKNASSFYALRQKDVNGLYLADGHISKLEYPMNSDSVKNAADKFQSIYHDCIEGHSARVYLSVIPDKNYFMAEKNGYPAIDYKELVSTLTDGTSYMEYIDIFDLLSLEDYYRTDSHWRQEKILPVAKRLASVMGADISEDYKTKNLEKPFRGVYYGQVALPLEAEQLSYLENEIINSCKVQDYETGSEIGIYNMEMAKGRDPYEMFLSGSKSILTIKNPMAENDRRLILFRDSFGSSIAPLLATGYSEVVVVDIRYVSSGMLNGIVDFEDSDVLFLYCAQVLNNSVTFK